MHAQVRTVYSRPTLSPLFCLYIHGMMRQWQRCHPYTIKVMHMQTIFMCHIASDDLIVTVYIDMGKCVLYIVLYCTILYCTVLYYNNNIGNKKCL